MLMFGSWNANAKLARITDLLSLAFKPQSGSNSTEILNNKLDEQRVAVAESSVQEFRR